MNCGDVDLKEQKRTDELITRQLKQERRKHKWEKILLLLGNCSSGKTTLIKQLKNVSGKGFSEDVRKKYVDVVHHCVQVSIKALLSGMAKLPITYSNPNNDEIWKRFVSSSTDDPCSMEINTSDYSMVLQLWRDSSLCRHRREFQLPESANYFLDNLDRIQRNDYIPSVEDILRTYEPTSGVEEHAMMIGSRPYRLVDVGRKCLDSQRKWIHLFNGCAVSAVLFMVDISEYDKTLFTLDGDNSTVNSLEHNRILFQKLSHYQYENFKNSVFIVLFNKEDIFDDKIRYSHLADHFPLYTGPKQDTVKAKNFIRDMFIDSMPDEHNHITIHFISSIDSNSAREVCKAVNHGVSHIYQFNSLVY